MYIVDMYFRVRKACLVEGMSKSEVIRCLKRYVAREVYSAIQRRVASRFLLPN